MDFSALTSGQAAAVGAFLGAVFIWVVCILVAYEILLIVSYWKLYNKAGEKGWKAIIPFYNEFIRYKLTWKKSIFWILLVLGVVSGVLSNLVSSNQITGVASVVVVLVALALCIAFIVISIVGEVKLAKAYGKGGGFAVILILTSLVALDWIPMLVLAFGKSKYVGSWKPAKK